MTLVKLQFVIFLGKGGHKSIVEALIKKYADVDIKGKDNKTCLHWAIDKNHTAIVKLLLTANPGFHFINKLVLRVSTT